MGQGETMRRCKQLARDTGILLEVMTLNEAAAAFHVHRNTLLYRIDEGELEARKSGRTWLVSVASLHRLYSAVKVKKAV